MKPKNINMKLIKLLSLSAVLVALPACESKTENAAEDVGEAVEDAAEETADAVEDATN